MLTSSTTSVPKHIPVTPEFDKLGQIVGHNWLYKIVADLPFVFANKIFAIVSPAVEGFTQGGVPVGSASGKVYNKMANLYMTEKFIWKYRIILKYKKYCKENGEKMLKKPSS